MGNVIWPAGSWDSDQTKLGFPIQKVVSLAFSNFLQKLNLPVYDRASNQWQNAHGLSSTDILQE